MSSIKIFAPVDYARCLRNRNRQTIDRIHKSMAKERKLDHANPIKLAVPMSEKRIQ